MDRVLDSESPGGVGGADSASHEPELYRNRRPRKSRTQKRYDTAMVALLAGRHVPEAIKTIATLMRRADRDSVRLKASTTMVELACGLEASDETEQGTKVYVLATAPEQTQGQEQIDTAALAERLRARLTSGQ